MNGFLQIMEKVMSFLKMKFTIYGHSISFWDVFIWLLVVSIVIGVLSSLIDS